MLTVRSSIRTRILFLTGTVISLLMLLISFVLLFKWRELIIRNQSENAVSISRTFAVTVIDAMIFEEQALYRKEDILETYANNFISRLGNVRYVAVFDRNGVSVVQVSAYPGADTSLPIVQAVPDGGSREVHIYRHDRFGWTMEVRHPLILSGRRWGTATIGFDAQAIRDEVRSVFFLLLSSTVAVTAVVLSILFVLISRITSSIERLVRTVDSIDFTGGRGIDVPEEQDEIGFFYQHFRMLQERLEASKRELQNAQKQIYQAEKLASIGRLASGVAHQVNNPLNGIKSCLYAIRQAPGDLQRTQEYLQLINEGINDIETVVKKLLGFARQQSPSHGLSSINDAVGKVVGLFELRLKEKKIELRVDLAEELDDVRIDTHLLQEIVMNLVLNSYDAVGENGMIAVTTGRGDASHVYLEVRDNGAGIAPEDMKRIFDPFFTTKDVGTGTGLGLSICMAIVESHGGRIDVHSRQNAETTFRITLPIAHEDETADHRG